MGIKVTEEEKQEKIIRNLLKESGNKKCINCGSMGPQYVCTTFWIFVCTACSGIHREFTHRVKSISMAKFTAAEVADLQAGGNEHARKLYFKDWDPHRHPLPDNRNPEKLRSFIKNVYEERRYAGEKSVPRGKQSPPYEDQYKDRSISDNHALRNEEREEHNRHSSSLGIRLESRFTNYEKQEEPKGNAGTSNRKLDEEKNLQASHVKVNHGRNASSPQTKNLLQKNGFPRLILAPVDSSKSSSRMSNSESSVTVQPSIAIGTSVLKRADSFSLIDLSVEPEGAARNSSAVPVGSTSMNTASEIGSDIGWANFDNQSTAGPVSSFASHDDFFASTNVGGQLTGELHSATTSSVQGVYDWASFGSQMQPLPSTTNFPELNFPQVPPVRSLTGQQQAKLQHDEPVLPPSSSTVHQSEKRQPIPEDFFVSSISSPSRTTWLDLGFQDSSQTPELPQQRVSAQVILPTYSQPMTPLNPFDLPGASSSHDTFPSLASFQSAFSPALSEENTAERGSLAPGQLPFLAVIPAATSFPQGNAAYHGKALHPTIVGSSLQPQAEW